MTIPSVTELSLLKCLWKQQPLSARELHDLVAEELQWSYSSTRKTLERMVEKQMVNLRVMHGINVMEMDEPFPVNMFTGSKLVNPAELAELEQILHDWPESEE
jgi:BlaI family penicillinase repressor